MCGSRRSHRPPWTGKKPSHYGVINSEYLHLQLGGGVTENPLDMGVLLRKRVSLVCSTLRSRSLHYKHRLVQEVNLSYNYVFYAFPILCAWEEPGNSQKQEALASSHTWIYESSPSTYCTATVCRSLSPSIWRRRAADSTNPPRVPTGPGQPGPLHHEGKQEHWKTHSRDLVWYLCSLIFLESNCS